MNFQNHRRLTVSYLATHGRLWVSYRRLTVSPSSDSDLDLLERYLLRK